MSVVVRLVRNPFYCLILSVALSACDHKSSDASLPTETPEPAPSIASRPEEEGNQLGTQIGNGMGNRIINVSLVVKDESGRVSSKNLRIDEDSFLLCETELQHPLQPEESVESQIILERDEESIVFDGEGTYGSEIIDHLREGSSANIFCHSELISSTGGRNHSLDSAIYQISW